MQRRNLIFCILCLLTGLSNWSCSDKGIMLSPDGKLTAHLSVTNGTLCYQVSFDHEQIISPSPLGIVINGDSLGKNVSFRLVNNETIDETYPTRGFHTMAINRANQYTYEVHSADMTFLLQARLYDDGFAFRYIIPGENKRLVNGELTTFRVSRNIPVWFFERPNHWKLKSYAGVWTRTVSDSLSVISPTGPVQGSVLLYELPQGKYMAITEAALYNYSGMRLEAKPDASLQANFTEPEGIEITGKITTPWRVIILANDLNELVNSDIITNLNPAPDPVLFADISWIKPGRCVWSWWSGSPGYMSVSYEKHFVDMAAELGYEYTLIDEGWERVWKDKWAQLAEFCTYADQKNVGVFVWKHSDQLNFPDGNYKVLENFLDSVKNAGAAGVKIDFMNGESKQLIDFDTHVLQLCAERRLMVNFHGCQKPSGESRTYPNEITREGIRGLELNKMDQHISGNHNVALVFTRCILNNADYTPVGFSNPGNTSWAHQLATAYAFTSPLLVIAEHPDTLLHGKGITPILPLIKTVPSVWNETIVLPESSIGETALLARRIGNEWYIVALNGSKTKQINVKADFLEEGKWEALIVKDYPNQQNNVIVENQIIDANDNVTIDLNPEGGYVARFTKKL